MIITDFITINDNVFKKTVSDTYFIRKVDTNEIYLEAIDVFDSDFEYEETDELLPKGSNESEGEEENGNA